MSITLDSLKAALNPAKTVLLFGAGASMPSGAPSGKVLAHRLWKDVGDNPPSSDDLTETASVLERKFTRRRVIECVVSSLRSLKPTGGILGIPLFSWAAVFSTNFDKLIENAFKQNGMKLNVIRSNYDLSTTETRSGTTLYKIHGCISQDRSLGDKASMILTEQDYEEFERYRQTVFAQLQSSIMMNDLLIIGQSLGDKHLQDLIKRVLKSRDEGSPGKIYLLVYDRDDLRAPLWEDRGAIVCFTGIDEFVFSMSSAASVDRSTDSRNTSTVKLPVSLLSTVTNVSEVDLSQPDTFKMFHGKPASYADIKAGTTFRRDQYDNVMEKIEKKLHPVVVVVGSAGVGKTTFGRQILSELSGRNWECFEHRNDFPFQEAAWLSVESDLRNQGKSGLLFIDECTRQLRQANILIDKLSTIKECSLIILMTANAAQWVPRMKSPVIFKKGFVLNFSRLVDSELYSLISLVEHRPAVASLVHQDFKGQTRSRQIERLRERCSADMFVCLKNIFENESLDTILLVEFDELEVGVQEYYRYVAALEAVGTHVHRNLLMRMLGLKGNEIASILDNLSGIIEEYDIRPKEGLFGWSTRHIVIARKITDYKFSGIVELHDLFNRIIENLNPAASVELQTVRDICDTEFGIGRLADREIRKGLYKKLTEIAPGERIPWHRLIREVMDSGTPEDVEHVIREAVDAVGRDAPIDRYKVRLLIARSKKTPGIADEDRLALLRMAYELAVSNTERHKRDKFSYVTLCDVAIELAQKEGNLSVLNEAVMRMRQGAELILDPDMDRQLRHYESYSARLH